MGCTNSKRGDDASKAEAHQVVCIEKKSKEQRHGQVEIIDNNLIFHKKGVPIVSWPLNKIRRYGFEDSMFCLESGNECESGPGIFCFKSKNARTIFNSVHGQLLETHYKTSKEYQMKEKLLMSMNMHPTINSKPKGFDGLSDNNDEILHAMTLPKAITSDKPVVPESDMSDYMEMTCGRPESLPTEDKIIYTEVQIASDSTSRNYKPPESPREKTEYVQIDFERTKLLNPLLFRNPDNSGLRRTRHDSTLSDE